MTLLRGPGEPAPVQEEQELRPGYGMCDETGHHGYAWIAKPSSRAENGLLYGKCASCVRRDESVATGR